MVESANAVKEWRADKSIPIAQVVDGFKVFVSLLHDIHALDHLLTSRAGHA